MPLGWSFSGLFALYAAVARPDLFDAYLFIGPAIWWDDELLVKMYRDIQFERPKRMVITLGSREKGPGVYSSTKRLLERLDQKPIQLKAPDMAGYPTGLSQLRLQHH